MIAVLFLAYVTFREPECCIGCPMWPAEGTSVAAAKRGCVLAVADHLVAVFKVRVACAANLPA